MALSIKYPLEINFTVLSNWSKLLGKVTGKINISIASGVNGVGTGDMAAFLGIISLSSDKYDPEMPVNILSVPLMTDKEKEQ